MDASGLRDKISTGIRKFLVDCDLHRASTMLRKIRSVAMSFLGYQLRVIIKEKNHAATRTPEP